MPSFTAVANQPLPAAVFNRLGAAPIQADVANLDNSTSVSYVDLGTAGPSVTLTLTNGQAIMIYVHAAMATVTSGQGFMSFARTGASGSASATDTDAAEMAVVSGTTNYNNRPNAWTVFTATATGSHTFTAKYKTNGSNVGFQRRRMIVLPKL
jgi:hypothetical protein